MNKINATSYTIMRNSVQLVDASIVEVHSIKKFKDEDIDLKFEQISNISYQLSEVVIPEFDTSKRYINGFMNYELKVTVIGSTECKLKVNIVNKGLFVMTDDAIKDEEFIDMVNKLCVPLLLPHLRGELAILLTLLRVPPIPIPTLDVLNSINANKIVIDILN